MPPADRPAMNVDIDVALVHQLITAQFPQYANLPITPAVPQGWVNRTFRLGADLSVRLPSAAGYVPQIEKEHCYLPCLALLLPLAIPVPLARGTPGAGYPFPWSVYHWLPGDPACDLVITWTFLSGASREAFRTALSLDQATWARARGWALWKALILVAGHADTTAPEAARSRQVIDDVLADYRGSSR